MTEEPSMPSLAELTPAECWSRLGVEYTAIVAFTHEGDVHGLPVNVCVRDRQVWFRTTEGLKLRAAAAGVRMAVVVERHDEVEHGGWSVCARGPASVEPEGPPRRDAPVVRPWRRGARGGAWVRIAVDTITGRQLVAAGVPS